MAKWRWCNVEPVDWRNDSDRTVTVVRTSGELHDYSDDDDYEPGEPTEAVYSRIGWEIVGHHRDSDGALTAVLLQITADD